MLKNIFVLITVALISLGKVVAQDLYKLEARIDTSFVKNRERHDRNCQSAAFNAFNFGSMSHMYLLSPELDKPSEKEDVQAEVHLKANVKYLFYWSDQYLYSFVYEEIDTIHTLDSLRLIHSDSLFNDYHKYVNTRELCICSTIQKEKFKTILLIDSVRQLNNMLDQLNFENIRTGVYWLLSPKRNQGQPHFLIVDQNGTKLLVKPVKYWVHMNAFKASDFKKNEYGKGLQYDDEDDFNRRSSLSKYLYKNYFYLVAEGEGNKALTQSSKWKMLVDYNAFGNFRCMLPNTIVPSKNIFTTPKIEGYDYEEVSKVFPYIDPNDSLNSISALSTSLGFVSFQLIEKIACTGIYRIHAPGAKISSSANSYDETELEPNTVNNLKYLPGIYFLPSYFEVKTINGLSKEEFIKNQCKN